MFLDFLAIRLNGERAGRTSWPSTGSSPTQQALAAHCEQRRVPLQGRCPPPRIHR
ncbi:hypothetical protein ACTMU2_00065 [Cupriavidus basilensis]